MKLSPYAKAIVATIAGAATPLAAAAAAHSGVLTTADLITALASAVVSGGAVFGVKNVPATVAGLVVKVVADLDRFKAALDTALQASLVIEPQLVTGTAPIPVVAPEPTPPVAG
jgi:hypothetical protein